MAIRNDKEFKKVLAALTDIERRQIAARLVAQVFELSGDARVKNALDLAARAEAESNELAVAANGVNSARVESFTRCGHDANWSSQAAHFVARAAQDCARTDVDIDAAWDCAMLARMARICKTLADGEGTDQSAAEAQYRAMDEFVERRAS